MTFHQRAHATESCSFQLLAAVQAITVLKQANVVLGYFVDEVASGVELTQGELVVVFIIENIHEISIEWMDIVDFWEFIDDGSEAVVPVALGEFHFAHIELSDALNSPACTYVVWELSAWFC